jgi:hypothetical protein
MTPFSFLHSWRNNFSGCPPVTHLFKQRLKARWFRFHSLPESKRYASDPIEFAELLHRQNTVLNDVIGVGQICTLVHDFAPGHLEEFPALAPFQWQKLLDLPKQDFDPEPLQPGEEPQYFQVFACQQPLQPLMLDEVLLLVADWKITNFFVVNAENTRIFAPYDGGVDVILANTAERDHFKAKYQHWLSHHPGGF